jgi:hypothetical protein
MDLVAEVCFTHTFSRLEIDFLLQGDVELMY